MGRIPIICIRGPSLLGVSKIENGFPNDNIIIIMFKKTWFGSRGLVTRETVANSGRSGFDPTLLIMVPQRRIGLLKLVYGDGNNNEIITVV